MKGLIKLYLVETASIYLVSNIVSGILLEKGLESLFLAGLGLTAVILFIKPVVNLLLLPLNLITFGLFRWVSSAVALFLATLVVPGFKISELVFNGFSWKYFSLPPLHLSGILAFIGFSLLISLVASLLHWLIK